MSQETSSAIPRGGGPLRPIVVRPARDTSFTLLDDRPVVFSQSGQKIYELNQVGACIWCRLAEGKTTETISEELGARGMDRHDARRFVQQALNQWLDLGLLDFDWEPPAGSKFQTRLSEFGVSFEASNPHLLERLQSVFCHSSDGAAEKSDILVEIMQFGEQIIFRVNGSRISRCPVDGLAPAVKAALIQQLIVRDGTELALHAASVVQRGQGLLICGAPGAGKSTLTLHLLDAGFRYGGDDVVLVAPDGGAQGLPFAPSAKPGSWKMASKLRSDVDHAMVHRRPDGIPVRYLPITEVHDGYFSTGWIVFLNRVEGAAADLMPIGQIETMGRVIDGSIAADGKLSQRAFAALKEMVTGAKSFELTYSDAADGCRALAILCHGQP